MVSIIVLICVVSYEISVTKQRKDKKEQHLQMPPATTLHGDAKARPGHVPRPRHAFSIPTHVSYNPLLLFTLHL